jgi:tetratricopeptide (TPR) repeat protein
MARIEKTVFISYRHTNVAWAVAIFQDLTQRGYDVFLDYTGIASGDFERVILENIRARAHFLVLLTPSALEGCGDPSDWLRREIEAALKSRRNIVPLMLEGFDFGTRAITRQLTGKLAVLKQYNALRVPPDYFSEAMVRLRDGFLNVPLNAVLHPESLAAKLAATKQREAAAKVPTVTKKELTAEQWFERGFNAGDIDDKMRFYSEAIRLNPRFGDALRNRGVTRAQKGDLEGALEDFNLAIRFAPRDAELFYCSAMARRDKGDLEGALKDYNAAIRLKPDYPDVLIDLGNLLRKLGDPDGALQHYNWAIRLEPDSAVAFNNRGALRSDQGDLEGATEDYAEAIRLNPDNPNHFFNRGGARREKGDVEGALRDYDEAIRLKPDFAGALLNRGVVREDKGDLKGALRDYDEAIRLKPDYADAVENREGLLKAIAERSRS